VQAPLAGRVPYLAPTPSPALAAQPPATDAPAGHLLGDLRLLRYRPLFAGPQVERVPELQFQRPEREVALSSDDAARRGITSGDLVTLRSNGTSVELRARVDHSLAGGVARVADEHADELHVRVEVVKT
jgi:anaerobic selenocysteine-containing dehydrogenase